MAVADVQQALISVPATSLVTPNADGTKAHTRIGVMWPVHVEYSLQSGHKVFNHSNLLCVPLINCRKGLCSKLGLFSSRTQHSGEQQHCRMMPTQVHPALAHVSSSTHSQHSNNNSSCSRQFNSSRVVRQLFKHPL